MLAAEVVEKTEATDIVVSDEEISIREGVDVIRSYDSERILALMNA